MTPAEYAATKARGYKVIDVSPAPAIPGAKWVDLAKVNGPIEGLAKDDKLLLVCGRGGSGDSCRRRGILPAVSADAAQERC